MMSVRISVASQLLSLEEYSVLLLCSLACVELFLRLSLQNRTVDLLKRISRAVKLLRSTRVSDHWKEKLSTASARRVFVLTAFLSLSVFMSLSPLAIGSLLLAGSVQSAITLLGSLSTLVLITLTSLFYLFLRVNVRR